MDVENFIADPAARNRWCLFVEMEVYLRKTPVFFNGEHVTAITIANMNSPVRLHRTGQFKRLVQLIRDTSNVEYIFVENVLEYELENYLMKEGWTIIPGYGNRRPHSFIVKR